MKRNDGIKMRSRSERNNNSKVDKLLKELNLKIKYHDIVDFAEKIHKINELKIEENKIRDAEISSINDKIHELLIDNYNLQQSIKEKINLRKQYEKEQKEISEYCNELRNKFFNSENVFKSYKYGINNLKSNYEKTQEFYDKKVEELMNENDKINKRINDRIDFYTHQKNQIIETNAKIERLKRELNDQNKLMSNRNKINKEKYNNLKEAYEDLKRKLSFMELDYYRDKTVPSTTISLTNNENNKNSSSEKKSENSKSEIKENEDNKNLLSQLDELSKKFKEFSITSDRFSKKETAVSKGKTSSKYKNPYSKSYY